MRLAMMLSASTAPFAEVAARVGDLERAVGDDPVRTIERLREIVDETG